MLAKNVYTVTDVQLYNRLCVGPKPLAALAVVVRVEPDILAEDVLDRGESVRLAHR